MKQTNQCYGHLKVEAKKNNNAALSETIKRIAVQLKQQRKTEKLNDTTTAWNFGVLVYWCISLFE